LDLTGPRLESALRGFVRDCRHRADSLHLPLSALRQFMASRREALTRAGMALAQAPARDLQRRRTALPVLRPGAVRVAQIAAQRRLASASARLDAVQTRTRRSQLDASARLAEAGRRLDALAPKLTAERRAALESLDRLRQTLGHAETLKRGFAIVRGPEGQLLTSAAAAASAAALELEFHDGRVP